MEKEGQFYSWGFNRLIKLIPDFIDYCILKFNTQAFQGITSNKPQ
jgi:hypothetical protein